MSIHDDNGTINKCDVKYLLFDNEMMDDDNNNNVVEEKWYFLGWKEDLELWVFDLVVLDRMNRLKKIVTESISEAETL